jgi:hypothetical protein
MAVGGTLLIIFDSLPAKFRTDEVTRSGKVAISVLNNFLYREDKNN